MWFVKKQRRPWFWNLSNEPEYDPSTQDPEINRREVVMSYILHGGIYGIRPTEEVTEQCMASIDIGRTKGEFSKKIQT